MDKSFTKEHSENDFVWEENAEVGDTLGDGSIVLKKENGVALLVSPISTQVKAPWTQEFPEVFLKLKKEGFNPSQWFVPTQKQLGLAYKVIPNEFSSTRYWSSEEYEIYDTETNASNAFLMGFLNGNAGYSLKTYTNCVRAFRCVTF